LFHDDWQREPSTSSGPKRYVLVSFWPHTITIVSQRADCANQLAQRAKAKMKAKDEGYGEANVGGHDRRVKAIEGDERRFKVSLLHRQAGPFCVLVVENTRTNAKLEQVKGSCLPALEQARKETATRASNTSSGSLVSISRRINFVRRTKSPQKPGTPQHVGVRPRQNPNL
jgi:hypothetical protein